MKFIVYFSPWLLLIFNGLSLVGCANYRDPLTGMKVERNLIREEKLRKVPDREVVEKREEDLPTNPGDQGNNPEDAVKILDCEKIVFAKDFIPPQLRPANYNGPKQKEVPTAFPTDFSWPLDLSFAEKFRGERSLTKTHWGLDISFSGGVGKVPVLAAGAGEIVLAEHQATSGFGNIVIVDHGRGWRTIYAHMDSLKVPVVNAKTQKVPVGKGAILGLLGATGNSTGPHLHFELKYYCENYDPRQVIPQRPSASELKIKNPNLFIWPN